MSNPILDVGLHDHVPSAVYHADPAPTPSLSSGVARTILSRSLAHAYAEHPRLGNTSRKESTGAMDMGSIVHSMLTLRAMDDVEVRDYPTFRSKAAQEWAESCRAAGKIPALQCDIDAARPIADAIMAKAAPTISDSPFLLGRPECTAIWKRDGAYFRARYDRLLTPSDAPWVAWDWKVSSEVGVAHVKRQMRRFGYHLQAAHYLAGMDALCPAFAGRHSFVFCFVEDAPPYSVRRYCLKPDTLGVAAIDIRKAHIAWTDALASNKWPDATRDETTAIDIPTFADDDEESDEISTQ